jgi:hypothetical protein
MSGNDPGRARPFGYWIELEYLLNALERVLQAVAILT